MDFALQLNRPIPSADPFDEVGGVGPCRVFPDEVAAFEEPITAMGQMVGEKLPVRGWNDGLRHGGLGAVVAEVARLSMTASRRLQLAAEGSGTIGIAIRRWRRPAEAADFGLPTASVTRWRVSALPATPLPVPGVGRPRWQLELIRCRAGESADFEVEGCDAKGRLTLSSNLVHGPAEKERCSAGSCTSIVGT